MSETATPGERAAQALARFNARNDPNGFFLRYCRGRQKSIRKRLLIAVTGAATFALLQDAGIGLLVATTFILGEVIDSLILKFITKRWSEADPAPRLAHDLALFGAICHGLAVVFCIALLWVLGHNDQTQFFAIAFLVGASMDAGVSLPFYRPATVARLGLYVAAFVVLEGYDFSRQSFAQGIAGRHGFELVASLMLAFVTALFIRFIQRTHDRRIHDSRTIVEDQQRLVHWQQALETKEREARRLALVAEYANDGVIIYAADGRIDWVNDTFARITGFRGEDLIGQRIEEVIPADDLDPDGVMALVSARHRMAAYRGELKSRRRSGEVFWIEANLTPIPAGDGLPPLMIAVERDITEAKAREAELARARGVAEEAAQAKARFLATMSHELRTPMNGVIGMAELLAETQLDADQRLYVDTIVDSGQALLAIINDILDLSRLQSGKSVLVAAHFELADCVDRAVGLMRPAARAKGIALAWDAPGQTPIGVRGDEGRLRQILLNLIGNAIKFTETGGVTVGLSVTDEAATRHVELSVADTGVGIREDRLAAIFESFTQADGEIGRRFGGTGLGLTISRRLAQEMGGDITVRSDLGAGSVFSLSVRLEAASIEAKPTNTTEPSRPARLSVGGRALKVLLVEDNRTNALIVERMLAQSGIEFGLARDGSRAVERFRETAPDIVLMDLSMPGKSGFEAMAEIRALDIAGLPRCPIVALTANAFDETREACLAAGFDGFVTKPVSRDALLSEMARHFGSPVAEALPRSGHARRTRAG